ncbi:Rv2578c family radical SAM protein [Labedella gwakjiensis]|nr:Rv2578c family radical SAM protein [Labedella gwakjiensis]RUQ81772.1 radical SAM protein [Labedella gwakjiensis]
MRWSTQEIRADEASTLPGLARINTIVRSVTTPEFAGVTFHEILAKSALNKVPRGSGMPFGWTINPYRGCSHACVYCFARPTHTYLDLNAGTDFDSQVIVKLNVAEVLERELAKPTWQHHAVALGTNTDPYQRAEGRYALMPGIITALASSGTPLSILTKGTLLRRDLPLLADAAEQVPIDIAMSIAIYDDELQKSIEPGTPSADARLRTVTAARDAGFDCSVFLMPVLPWLTDTTEHLDAAMRRIAAAGATSVLYSALYLKPGVKPWFMHWLERTHPELVPRYREMYSAGSYAPKAYRQWLANRIRPLIRAHGLDEGREDPATGGIRSSALGMFRGPDGERRPLGHTSEDRRTPASRETVPKPVVRFEVPDGPTLF